MKTHRRRAVVATAAVASLVGLVATAAVTSAVASSSPTSRTSKTTAVRRLHLVERVKTDRFIDLGKHGMSIGDHAVTRSDVLDPSGRLIGHSDGECVITGVGAQLGGLCHGVLTLAGGQLVGAFAWGRSGSNRYQAIIGGTGIYAGARGQAVVDTNGTDAHEPFVIELVS
jgi:allene oxide cyclase-like protein